MRSKCRNSSCDRTRDRSENEELRSALEESVKLQSHYAKILNMFDEGRRLQFKDGSEWLKRLAYLRMEAGDGPDDVLKSQEEM